MSVSHRTLRSLAGAAAIALVASTASAQEFLQFDVGPSDTTLSASATRGTLGANLTVSRFSDGTELTLSASHAIPITAFGADATLRLGPSVVDPEDGSAEFGARVVFEQYRETDWGALFILGEVNSANGGYFALVQPILSNGISIDLTAVGNDTDYSEYAIAVNRRIGDSPFRARAGYRFEAREVFLGVSINTY